MPKYLRKVFRIQAIDSPNVRLGMAQERVGQQPSNETLIPGVITYPEYKRRRQLWDQVRQSIGLDAAFWEGAEALLFPVEWLNRAEMIAASLGVIERKALAIGCDPAQGGDETCWTVVDDLGVIEQIAKRTPDTSIIPGDTIALGRKHAVNPENWIFDAGGGGYDHVCLLRSQGYAARSVAFGESVSDEPSYIEPFDTVAAKVESKEERYVHKDRRAQMYWNLRRLLDPMREKFEGPGKGFGIPAEHSELRRQLSPIPLDHDREGRHYVIPKDKKPNSHERCLKELIGCSPDRADSLVLAVWGMLNPQKKLKLRIW